MEGGVGRGHKKAKGMRVKVDDEKVSQQQDLRVR